MGTLTSWIRGRRASRGGAPVPVQQEPAAPSPPELDWASIPVESLPDHPGLLEELLDRTRDGVTIEGIFSDEEIDRVLTAIDRLPDDRRLHIAFGWLIGMPLGMITEDEPDRSRYLDAADEARADYLELFGFDPHERIATCLAPITHGLHLIGAPDSGRNYNAGQIRGYAPGAGGLPAHVGNEFRRQLENGAMKSLVTTTRLTDHLSYFVVLRRPESGGALKVYDLTWEQNDGRDSFGDVKVAFPDDDWMADVPFVDIDPAPGSMVLFGGGWRWHRIDPIEGEVERVTYGGFCAPSVDGTELHFWS